MKKLNIGAALLGMGVFAGVVWKVGATSLAADLEQVWMGFVLLLLLSLLRLLLQTCSWSISVSANHLSHSFIELLGIRLASQSLGYLSTFGPLLSEPLKIRLLGPSTQSATSTLVDTGIYWFTSGLFGIFECAAAALLLLHSAHGTWFVLFPMLLLCGLVILSRQSPLLGSVISVLGKRSPGWLKRGASLEGEVRRFRFAHPHVAHKMFSMDLVCQAMLACEVAGLLWALGVHVSLLTVLAIEVCTRAVKLAAGWLPARIGADETGAIGTFVTFGLSPASGLTLALARRIRDLLWCVCGLMWLGWNAHRSRTQRELVVKEEVECSL
jgi:uncharacterized membrane protein YbhN (UPF0104 family)